VRAALEAGAAVDARDAFGDTALNHASRNGHLEVVDLLLAAGADVENVGAADMTALMQAATAGHVGVVRRLLAAGAKVREDLLRAVSLKVRILEENAEAGMVRPEAAQAWRAFLESLLAEYDRQRAPS
jgi:ankyrin repeat protein